MAIIPLTHGLVCVVDDADFEWLSQKRWWAIRQQKSGDKHVAKTYMNGRNVSMHRLILNAPAHLEVDHIDFDTLNNRRNNLRLCTHAENSRHRRVRSDCKSGLKGVYQNKHGNWHATIFNGIKQVHLGVFKSKEEAALAYNARALELFGTFAHPNAL